MQDANDLRVENGGLYASQKRFIVGTTAHEACITAKWVRLVRG